MAGCDAGIGAQAVAAALFQSSPDAMAGCDQSSRVARTLAPLGFNPHPTRWPGATCGFRPFARAVAMFQSSPDAMAGCDDGDLAAATRPAHVSILTRRDGRVRPPIASSPTRPCAPFQSSPDAMAGCDQRWSPRCEPHRYRFNPHPTRWPGATGEGAQAVGLGQAFQSSPDAMAGCDGHGPTVEISQATFQSSPDAMAGCDAGHRPPQVALTSFNPHPTRWPGATLQAAARRLRTGDVSILTRRDGRVRRDPHRLRDPRREVSILTRRDGRVRRLDRRPVGGMVSGFNPHPTR